MKKLLIAVAVSAIASSPMAFTISVGDQSEFRPVEKSYQKTGTPISHESMNLMREGIDKSSVYDVLGVPHYGTGIFPANKPFLVSPHPSNASKRVLGTGVPF